MRQARSGANNRKDSQRPPQWLFYSLCGTDWPACGSEVDSNRSAVSSSSNPVGRQHLKREDSMLREQIRRAMHGG